jgi:hypothetical protein
MTPLTKRFIEYWSNFSKDKLIPKQYTLDHRELAEFAANFMMYEAISETHIRVRMAVSEMVRRYRNEITGHDYMDYVSPGNYGLLMHPLNKYKKVHRAFMLNLNHN